MENTKLLYFLQLLNTANKAKEITDTQRVKIATLAKDGQFDTLKGYLLGLLKTKERYGLREMYKLI